MHKRSETAANCPNKRLRHKIHLFSLPVCQEKINKVIFVGVHLLENNGNQLTGFYTMRAHPERYFPTEINPRAFTC